MANSFPFFLIPLAALATYIGVRWVIILIPLCKENRHESS